jgi:WD40 repeat protein
MDISKDCQLIALLAHKIENNKVVLHNIAVWEWRNKADHFFMCEYFDTDSDPDEYSFVRFNPNSVEGQVEFLTQGKHKILFWNITPDNSDGVRPYFPWKPKVGDKKVETNSRNHSSKTKEVIYTQSTFLNGSDMAITATNAGYVIVWDICEALCKESEVKTDRRKIKTVQLIKHKKDTISDKDEIKFLLNYEKNIVVGSGDGAIRFYDYSFIIVRWFENVCWPVTSISFDMKVRKEPTNFLIAKDYSQISALEDNTETGNTNNFTCKPFITADISATITRVSNFKKPFIDYADETVSYEEIYRGVESTITALALHPKKQILIIGTDPDLNKVKHKKEAKQKESIIREKKFEYKPYIQLFYYPDHMRIIKEEIKKREEEHNKLKEQEKGNNLNKNHNVNSSLLESNSSNPHKRFLESAPRVLEFSPDGEFLMVGTVDEKILVFDAENLSIIKGPMLQIKEYTDQGVTASLYEIIFSSDGKYFAASDISGRIGLFKNENPFASNPNAQKEWTLLGRNKLTEQKENKELEKDAKDSSLTKEPQILSICFCVSDKDKILRLYALSRDKYLHEFEVSHNTNFENLILISKYSLKIEHDCNVASMVSNLPFGVARDNLIIANDDFKLRSIMLSETADPLIKSTCLGPCYGSHIKKLRMIPGHDKDRRLMTFSTGQKIFGLVLLPVDGNPFRYMGVIGHPESIQDIRPAKNHNYILTTGGTDFIINGWKYNIDPLSEAVLNNGTDLKPFLTLLEGGEDGVKFQEMKNLFYYAQIKSKDEDTTKQRTLSETVNTSYIQGLLSALDYYPSLKEVSNIVNEINKSEVKTDGVTFEMFVKYNKI